jgi:hypothetical protein
MRDFVKKPSPGTPQLGSPVVDAIDAVFAQDSNRGPLEAEIVRPLIEAAGQLTQLRDGRLGALTLEQRQALNLAHAKLGQALATLRQLGDGTAAPAEDAVAFASRSAR